MPPLQGEWLEALKPEFSKPYYKPLFEKINQEYQTKRVFPRLTISLMPFILLLWKR